MSNPLKCLIIQAHAKSKLLEQVPLLLHGGDLHETTHPLAGGKGHYEPSDLYMYNNPPHPQCTYN